MSSDSSTKRKQDEKGDNPLIKAYLVAYNVAQMLGWSVLMIVMVSHLIRKRAVEGLYNEVECLLQICQTAAVLEILHAMIGLVRSNWVLTAFQVYSRVFLIWGVIWTAPVTQVKFPLVLWLSAWTITEIIRYSFYFFSLLPGNVPYALVWCRYTFFIVLYPIGVTGELLSIIASLPYIQDKNIYSFDLPNKMNISFSYYYYLCFILVSYLPVFPQLYLHMFSQRRKIIGGGGSVGASASKKTN